MKKILFAVLAFAMAMSVSSAQESAYAFRKGYRGNVALGCNMGVTKNVYWNSFAFTTSHGYSFGDGAYVGAGTGLSLQFSKEVAIPVFFDVKYNIVDWKLSPFVDCRVGGEGFFDSVDGSGGGLMVSPGIGADFHRFSFRVGYLYESGKYRSGVGEDVITSLFKLHSMTVSVAFNF